MTNRGAQRLAEYRDRHGYKQYELSELLDIPEANLSRLLNGTRLPGRETAIRIEDKTGVPVRSWSEKPLGSRKKLEPDKPQTAEIC